MTAPTGTQLTTRDRVATVRDLLEKSRQQIANALPKHLTPERMIRIALTTVQRNPKLLECDPVGLIGCVMEASQLGLEIGGILGQCYLVPYWNGKAKRREAQLQVGYKGFLALARRSGEVARFAAHEVKEADLFDYEYGSSAFLRHKPARGPRGQTIYVYAELLLKDGAYDFEVMSREDVEEHRQRYAQASSEPWQSAWDEMAKKTVIRRLAKRAPVSTEMQRAASLDEYAEAGIGQQLAPPDMQVSRADQVAAQLALRAGNGKPNGDQATPEQREEIDRLMQDLAWSEEDFRPALARVGCKGAEALTQAQAEQVILNMLEVASARQEPAERQPGEEG